MTQDSVKISSYNWSARQIMLATIFVVSVALGFWLLYRFRAVIFILFISILLGTAIKPAVEWLAQRRVPRSYGEVLIFLLLLAAITGFLWLAVPLILEQSTALLTLLSDYYRQLRAFMLLSPSDLIQRLGYKLPFQLQLETLVQNPPTGPAVPEEQPVTDTVAQMFRIISLMGKGIFSIVAVFLMAFYWTLEGDRAIRSIVLLLPADRREGARTMVEAIQAKLGGFLLGQAILCLTIAILQLIAYLLIGLPNALVLALIAGVLEAVPTLGPILGAVPAVLIAASTDPSKILWVLVAAGIIQFLENNLLVPRVMDKSVGVSPLLTLLSLAALTSLLGLAGALLAIPVAAIIQLVADRFVLNPDDNAQLSPEGRDHISLLRYQAQEIAQDVRKQIRNKDDVVDKTTDLLEDEIEALANDLDRILSQSSHAGASAE